jgi:hypothetical protein
MGLYLLWTVAGSFVLVWALAVTGAVALGPWVHLLLLIAIALLLATETSRPRTI